MRGLTLGGDKFRPAIPASRNGGDTGHSQPGNVARRCLIVDDNRDFLDAAKALLEQQGMTVVGVASIATDAVSCTAALRPDVALLDVDLDGESGFDLARRLAAGPAEAPGFIVMISAQAEDDVLDLLHGNPAIGFVGKSDLSADAIERLIRAAAARSAG
jgi:DNA-binding NarL/FixJ family response regulator